MEKLKKKTFFVIFFILTIFLISILCIFNYQDYSHEKNEIQNNLMKMEDNKEQFDPNENKKSDEIPKDDSNDSKPPVFMDVIAYTVIYNDNNEIIDVINHTQNEISDEEIKNLGQDILNKSDKESMKIGNLYFDNYSYSFKGHNSLTIIDNEVAQKKLISLLRTSFLLFILLEIVIVIISLQLTKWIIKPVIESFNKQKQFIADASHELKTPIAVIMANVEALENEPQEHKWFDNIKNETERMNGLVTDLLDLARLEDGRNLEKYNIENVSKIVEKSVLTFESLIYENKIKLNYNIQENINIKCNKNQISQLVAILLDNAIKHSIDNGEIIVTLNKEKNDVILKVTNKGKEIPKQLQNKIFERFYREDESRNRDSNRYGLGLAIAKNIVNNHKGKILVQSENGYTTFIVKLK